MGSIDEPDQVRRLLVTEMKKVAANNAPKPSAELTERDIQRANYRKNKREGIERRRDIRRYSREIANSFPGISEANDKQRRDIEKMVQRVVESMLPGRTSRKYKKPSSCTTNRSINPVLWEWNEYVVNELNAINTSLIRMCLALVKAIPEKVAPTTSALAKRVLQTLYPAQYPTNDDDAAQPEEAPQEAELTSSKEVAVDEKSKKAPPETNAIEPVKCKKAGQKRQKSGKRKAHK